MEKESRTMKETWINPWEVQTWFLNGQRHRDGRPASIWPAGTRHWYQLGNLHREDGPAVIETGPAMIWSDGNRFWYLEGQSLKEEEWKKRVGR